MLARVCMGHAQSHMNSTVDKHCANSTVRARGLKQKPLLCNRQGSKIKLLIKRGKLGAWPMINANGSLRLLCPAHVCIEELQRHPHAQQCGAGTNSATMGGERYSLSTRHVHQQGQDSCDSGRARLSRVQHIKQSTLRWQIRSNQLSNQTHTKSLQPRYSRERHKPKWLSLTRPHGLVIPLRDPDLDHVPRCLQGQATHSNTSHGCGPPAEKLNNACY